MEPRILEVETVKSTPGIAPHPNMAWIPGGNFRMGSEEFYPEERPVHQVHVDGFLDGSLHSYKRTIRKVRCRNRL